MGTAGTYPLADGSGSGAKDFCMKNVTFVRILATHNLPWLFTRLRSLLCLKKAAATWEALSSD
jgi:hypothetical protein